MKKLFLFSLAITVLCLLLISTLADAQYRGYCNWSGCCSDNYCTGYWAKRIGGTGGCGSQCYDEYWFETEKAWCTSVSAGCPSGGGPGDHPHRTPDAQ